MALGDHPVKILDSDDGEPVALHDFGGDGPNVLLGHGNGLNAGMWAAALPHLQSRFRCFGVDLRGHGATRTAKLDYSVDRWRFAEDIFACIDEIGGPVRYAGHSLGGASAVYAALVRPEAFIALWLYEPVLVPEGFDRPDGGQPSFLVEAARRRRMEFESVDDAFERFSSKAPFSGCDPVAVRGYVDVGTYPIGTDAADTTVRLSCDGRNEARVFESGQPLDFARFAELTMPAIVAAGAEDDGAHAVPSTVAPLVAAALGNAELQRHPELSHFGPMEAPAKIADSITALFT